SQVAAGPPAATATPAGPGSAASFDASVTAVPPVGAAAFNVTVPVELAIPPTTVVGLTVTVASIGFTVSVAVLFTLAYVPVIVTVWFAVTTDVVAVNVAVVAPAATGTDTGTDAAAWSDADDAPP